MSNYHLLLADDDIELCELLARYLSNEGFKVSMVHDGEAAVSAISVGGYDVLVLDIMMPKKDGFEALRELRKSSAIPVLMLTARGDDVDRIVGLEMGADDYLAKPCNPRELLARIRAILRRVNDVQAPLGSEQITVDDISLSPSTRQVSRGQEVLDLTSTEFNVLLVLLRNAGEVIAKSDLTQQALDRKLTEYDRSIDVHVSNIRRKLGKGSTGEARIKTIRGVGFIYVNAVVAESR